MKLRLKLLHLVLYRSKALVLLPFLAMYCFIPILAIVKYLRVGTSEALQVFVYASQILLPLCGILLPMGYLYIWVDGNAREALRAYSAYHKSCIGEVIILYGVYILMLFPTILFAVVVLGASWLEYVRLVIQVLFVVGFFYFTAMIFQNVTLGCIPVIGYLFLCFCICDSAEFADYSIIEPLHIVQQYNWNTLFTLIPVSIVMFQIGYLCDRFLKKYD